MSRLEYGNFDRHRACNRRRRFVIMPEPDWDKEHVYTFGPSILSNPQRWKARTNAAYQLKHTYWYGNQSLPTKQDLKQYADKFPEEADKLRRMRATAVTSGYTTLAGLLGGLAYARKITKSPPVIAVSGFFTALTGFYVGDDVRFVRAEREHLKTITEYHY